MVRVVIKLITVMMFVIMMRTVIKGDYVKDDDYRCNCIGYIEDNNYGDDNDGDYTLSVKLFELFLETYSFFRLFHTFNAAKRCQYN